MKSFALVLFVAQAVILQSAYSQFVRSSKLSLSGPIINSPCGCSSPIISTPILSPINSACGCSSPILTPVVSAPVLAPAVSSIVSPTIYSSISSPSVANSLADTLSLLTVSSLLADTLPLSYPSVVSTVPVIGGGCGCGGCGYSFF